MNIRIGTEYFVNLNAAIRYYGPQGESRKEVEQKAKRGEIKFGMPPRKEGYRIVLNNKEGRYFYEEVAPAASTRSMTVSDPKPSVAAEHAKPLPALADEAVQIPLVKEGDPVPEFVKAAEGFCGFGMWPTDQFECKGVGEDESGLKNETADCHVTDEESRTVLFSGETVQQAEQFIATELIPKDPTGVAEGKYGIDAPEEKVNPPGAKVEIKTNNVPKELLFFNQLNDKERAALGKREDTNSFFRLKGKVYDAGEFTQINSTHQEGYGHYDPQGRFKGWDGIDFDAGVLIRYPRDKDNQIDPERVIIGTFTVEGAESKDPRAENNVPNLDAETDVEKLREFWKKHEGGKRLKDLFPSGGEGTKNATSELANYAINKLTAIQCRLEGKIQEANEYDRVCDLVYKDLPTWARSW